MEVETWKATTACILDWNTLVQVKSHATANIIVWIYSK